MRMTASGGGDRALGLSSNQVQHPGTAARTLIIGPGVCERVGVGNADHRVGVDECMGV